MDDHRLAYARATLAAPASSDGPITFTASTERLNRYGFALRHEGWRIENYRANPVVLWMHNPFTPPIGRGSPALQERELRVAVTFDVADELGREVDRKYRGGMLHAVSVGFDFVWEDGKPIANWWGLSNDEIHDKAFYDLAELSAVSVPADPGAVKQHQQALALLSRELVDLYRLRQETEPDTPPAWFGLALRDELERLGIEPGRLAAIPSHDTAVVDEPWDAAAEVAAAPNERAVLRYMHAWVDSEGDADAKGSYKFPHHAARRGSAANLPGVRNALSRLPQADIPEADRAGVERHLRRHLDAQERTEETRQSVDDSAAQLIYAAFGQHV